MEGSPEFLDEIKRLNEVWYVFVGLTLVMALIAFFIHRNLQRRESIKADFRANAHAATQNDNYASDDSEKKIDYDDNKIQQQFTSRVYNTRFY